MSASPRCWPASPARRNWPPVKNHRNIVTIYEIGEAGGLPYIAMELLDGAPLGQWLAQARPQVDEALRMLAGVGAALDHAHQRKVTHRDVKPANILVAPGRGAGAGRFRHSARSTPGRAPRRLCWAPPPAWRRSR
jgi:serine/threonine protein kinase